MVMAVSTKQRYTHLNLLPSKGRVRAREGLMMTPPLVTIAYMAYLSAVGGRL
jgi:hypothetical protein